MDTPFGRLDQRHRENVLKHISTMSEQVIILAHSGEVDQTAIDSIKGQIDQEFVIAHPTSTISYIKGIGTEFNE